MLGEIIKIVQTNSTAFEGRLPAKMFISYFGMCATAAWWEGRGGMDANNVYTWW